MSGPQAADRQKGVKDVERIPALWHAVTRHEGAKVFLDLYRVEPTPARVHGYELPAAAVAGLPRTRGSAYDNAVRVFLPQAFDAWLLQDKPPLPRGELEVRAIGYTRRCGDEMRLRELARIFAEEADQPLAKTLLAGAGWLISVGGWTAIASVGVKLLAKRLATRAAGTLAAASRDLAAASNRLAGRAALYDSAATTANQAGNLAVRFGTALALPTMVLKGPAEIVAGSRSITVFDVLNGLAALSSARATLLPNIPEAWAGTMAARVITWLDTGVDVYGLALASNDIAAAAKAIAAGDTANVRSVLDAVTTVLSSSTLAAVHKRHKEGRGASDPADGGGDQAQVDSQFARAQAMRKGNAKAASGKGQAASAKPGGSGGAKAKKPGLPSQYGVGVTSDELAQSGGIQERLQARLLIPFDALIAQARGELHAHRYLTIDGRLVAHLGDGTSFFPSTSVAAALTAFRASWEKVSAAAGKRVHETFSLPEIRLDFDANLVSTLEGGWSGAIRQRLASMDYGRQVNLDKAIAGEGLDVGAPVQAFSSALGKPTVDPFAVAMLAVEPQLERLATQVTTDRGPAHEMTTPGELYKELRKYCELLRNDDHPWGAVDWAQLALGTRRGVFENAATFKEYRTSGYGGAVVAMFISRNCFGPKLMQLLLRARKKK